MFIKRWMHAWSCLVRILTTSSGFTWQHFALHPQSGPLARNDGSWGTSLSFATFKDFSPVYHGNPGQLGFGQKYSQMNSHMHCSDWEQLIYACVLAFKASLFSSSAAAFLLTRPPSTDLLMAFSLNAHTSTIQIIVALMPW